MPTVEQIMQAVSDYGRAEQTGSASDIGNAFKRVERMIQQAVQQPIRSGERKPDFNEIVLAWNNHEKYWNWYFSAAIHKHPDVFTHWMNPTPPQE